MLGAFSKLYHSILTDERTSELSNNDFGVFVRAIIYCSREEKDGRFSARALEVACHSRGLAPSLLRLTSAGLLSQDGQNYVILQYLKYQTSKSSIEGKRAASAEKKRLQRERLSRGDGSDVPTTPNTENREQRTENREQRTESLGGVGEDPPKPPKTPKSRKPATSVCPEDFKPRAQDASKARDSGVDVTELVEELIDWSKQNPRKNRKADWDATFRAWCRKRASNNREKNNIEDRKDKRYQGNSNNLTEVDRQYVEKQEREHKRREESREQTRLMREEAQRDQP